MPADLTDYKARRSSIKGSITKLKNFVDTNFATMTEFDATARLGLLETYFQQFMEVQENIERLDGEEMTKPDRELYVETYCQVKAKLLSLTMSLHRTSLTGQDMFPSILNVSQPRLGHSRLPKLELPSFSGKYTDWQDFFKSFTTLVHNDDALSTIEKFSHLRNCLKESASNTIKALEMTEENYEEALKLLKLRYDNKRLIFQAHVRAICEIKPISKSSESLRYLLDTVNANLRALSSLGNHEEIASAFLLFLVTSKLDGLSLSKWEEEAPTATLPKWADLEKCLTKRCNALENKEYNHESSSTSTSKPSSKPTTFRPTTRHTTLNTTISNAGPSKHCGVCESSDHDLSHCQKFNLFSVADRFNQVKKLNLCINCLLSGHRVRFCKFRRCTKCHQRHHTLLHREDERPVQPLASSSQSQSQNNIEPKTTLHSSCSSGELIHNNNTQNSIILATAVVNVRDRYGEIVKCRVILDSASQLNFISERLAQMLRKDRMKTDVTISGLNDISTRVKTKVLVNVESRVSSFSAELEMLVVPKITTDQPSCRISIAEWNIPSSVQLADPDFNVPQRVDVLLGAGIFYDLMGSKHIKLSDDLPSVHETSLGWIVAGKISFNERKYVFSNIVEQQIRETDPENALDELLERFWTIEGIGLAKQKQWTKEEEECEQHFMENVTRNSVGRFVVELPLRKDVGKLGDSLWTAKKRFMNLEKRLHSNPDLLKQYSQFLSEYESLSHMNLITESDHANCVYFLPHHCVVKPQSSSTKLRVVFDASSSSGESLNSILKVGPTIQRDLFSIVLRFRSHKYALTADITKMYRQVLVKEPQPYLQCILWRTDPSSPLKMYRLNTVTYGTAPASFLVIRCLKYLADEHTSSHPIGARCLANDFYVDDMLSGADTIEEALKLRKEVTEILTSGCFDLRKWSSSNSQLLDDVPVEMREGRVSIESNDQVKTLGLAWYPKNDVFRYEYAPKSISDVITKRSVLSDIATLFDPLGLLNPVVVSAKIFMQHLWRLKFNWDTELPEPYRSYWTNFRSKLSLVNTVEFPRFFRATKYDSIELHGFSDASTIAYGCCIYIRCLSKDRVTCRLVCAKSRVAPIKTLSLPRLELCASEMLAHLLSRVIEELDLNFNKVYCWTDSEIVLCWLAAHPSNWTAFVSNRVSTIQHLTDKFSWLHVDTRSNPADLVSRGVSPEKLKEMSLWFEGPQYLLHDISSWPVQRNNHEFSDVVERRKTELVLHTTKKEDIITTCKFVNAFPRLKRVFAYVIRFCDIHMFKRKRESSTTLFTPSEMSRAVKFLVRVTQRSVFSEEYKLLQDDKPVSNGSSLKFLSPFIDDEKLIRVGGRLQQSGLSYDVTHPMLLPNYTLFVFSLFEHFHFRNMHAGPQSLLAAVRQQFWVIRGRNVARQVVHKCIVCFKCRPKLFNQVMGSLPAHRVQPARPFVNSGVDFCGPVMVHYKQRGRTPSKAYIAVFVCFASKAVHLEVVSDLSADTFIAALKRFIARRGFCHTLYCDNATNFVGGRRQMQEFREQFFNQEVREHIVKACTEDNIKFVHIPPRSPHFGGLWESAVKSAKHHLNRCMEKSNFTYEELTTTITQIEAIMNSRPLTQMSSDPGDLTALTPGHFIIGEPLTAMIEPDLTEIKIGRLSRFQQIRRMQQVFWDRWSKEYVTQLQSRAKWRTSTNINLDTMVLVSEDNVPPQKWVLGRIIQLHPGADGRTRVVTVKTPTGQLRRAIHKLAPLPIDDNEMD